MKWYAVYVRPRAEKAVAKRFTAQGVENFVAVQRQLRKWSDRKKWVDVVVLTGYVFVKIDISKKLMILQTFGVSKFIGGWSPIAIDEADMKTFVDFISEVRNPVAYAGKNFKPGDDVVAYLADRKLPATVIEKRGKHRYYIYIDKLGFFVETDRVE